MPSLPAAYAVRREMAELVPLCHGLMLSVVARSTSVSRVCWALFMPLTVAKRARWPASPDYAQTYSRGVVTEAQPQPCNAEGRWVDLRRRAQAQTRCWWLHLKRS